MLNYGLSGLDIIKQIQKEIYNLDLDGRGKMVLVDKCGEAEFRMSEGSDEFVQLEAFIATYPRSPLADDASEQLAQLAFSDGRQEEGIRWLAQILSRYPKSDRAAAAFPLGAQGLRRNLPQAHTRIP